MGDNDGLILLSAATLANVDIMLESGTAGGRSAELMGRFFRGSHVQTVTVDLGKPELMGRCASKVEDTHKRLKYLENLTGLIGDSSVVFPQLIKQHGNKRIG